MMKERIRSMLGQAKRPSPEGEEEEAIRDSMLQEDQHERLVHDKSILDGDSGSREERVQREAEKEVRSAAEVSLKRLHLIQRGRCPKCGEHLRQHLFASVCDSCGWHAFDTPRSGPVRVHLVHGNDVVEGERCYVVKTGAVLIVRGDVVVARIPAAAVNWVEYVWDHEELSQRHRQVVDRMAILCGWCNTVTQPEKDGFHMAQVAFGASQERYCFCTDACYEAFRKMYPARVHRDCYERNCAECPNLCVKRYEDEVDGMHVLAKDYLQAGRKR